MATRTIKFNGKAYSTTGDVSVTLNFNGSQVYSGTVTTVSGETPTKPIDTDVLFTFETTTDVTGSIPLSISVTGGSLMFDSLFGNYSGKEVDNTDPDNPIVVNPPEEVWSDMNTNTVASDGKNNVAIDGIAQIRNPITDEEAGGEWFYIIPDGSTLTCDYVIDADAIVLE
jgi:hypothetical protein